MYYIAGVLKSCCVKSLGVPGASTLIKGEFDEIRREINKLGSDLVIPDNWDGCWLDLQLHLPSPTFEHMEKMWALLYNRTRCDFMATEILGVLRSMKIKIDKGNMLIDS